MFKFSKKGIYYWKSAWLENGCPFQEFYYKGNAGINFCRDESLYNALKINFPQDWHITTFVHFKVRHSFFILHFETWKTYKVCDQTLWSHKKWYKFNSIKLDDRSQDILRGLYANNIRNTIWTFVSLLFHCGHQESKWNIETCSFLKVYMPQWVLMQYWWRE